jgi:hypothetical protein
MTTKFATRIIVLMTIAFFAFSLSGCAKEIASAAYSNSDTTTRMTVNFNTRINGCSASSQQIILNEVNSQVNANGGQPLSISTDEWLNGQMARFGCIAAK